VTATGVVSASGKESVLRSLAVKGPEERARRPAVPVRVMERGRARVVEEMLWGRGRVIWRVSLSFGD
jgi:hypothetical protein